MRGDETTGGRGEGDGRNGDGGGGEGESTSRNDDERKEEGDCRRGDTEAMERGWKKQG